jgi:hypothetical protein
MMIKCCSDLDIMNPRAAKEKIPDSTFFAIVSSDGCRRSSNRAAPAVVWCREV